MGMPGTTFLVVKWDNTDFFFLNNYTYVGSHARGLDIFW